MIGGQGGSRGPELTRVTARYSPGQVTAIIANGRGNMPAYINNLKPEEMEAIVAFLVAQGDRSTTSNTGAVR